MTEAANDDHKAALNALQDFCDTYAREKQSAMSENEYVNFCALSKKVHESGLAVPRPAPPPPQQPRTDSSEAAERRSDELVQAVASLESDLQISDVVTLLHEGLNNGDEVMQHAALLAAAKLLSDDEDGSPDQANQQMFANTDIMPELVRALKRTNLTTAYAAVLGNVLRLLAGNHPQNQTTMREVGIIPLVVKRLMRMGRVAGKRTPALVEAVGRLAEKNSTNRMIIANSGIIETLVAWLPVREPDEEYPDVVIAATLKLLMTDELAAPDWANKGPLGFQGSTQVLMHRFIMADGLEALSRSRALLNSDLEPGCCQMLEWLWSFGGQDARRRCWKAGLVSRLASVVCGPPTWYVEGERVDAFRLLGEIGNEPGPIREAVLATNVASRMINLADKDNPLGNTPLENTLCVMTIDIALRQLGLTPLYCRRLRPNRGKKRPYSA
jgi:hypothetical protein